MDFTTLSYEQREGVGVVLFQKPDRLNPISEKFLEELIEVLRQAKRDQSVRAMVLSGSGRAFSAGGDLGDLRPGFDGVNGFVQHMELVNHGIMELMEFEKPVIAAVNGAAVGAGMNLALACDIVFASEKAKFSEIFGQLGLSVDLAGTYLLPRLVGRSKAKELVFSYRMIDAAEALEMGIVNWVVPHEQLMTIVMDYAKQLAKGPTLAFKLAKKLIDRSFETDVKTMLDLEQMAQALCANSKDHKEGVDAFFDKRIASFRGE